MRDAGRFVALEGGEGAGKSTQAALLSAWLTEVGVRHHVAREPGGTPVGEAIRSVVLDRPDLLVSPEAELFLILAARAAFVRDVVRPRIEAGEFVVADRFALSTMAYQGYGRGLDLEEVRRANALATGGLEPDLYLVLDVPTSLGARRQHHGGKRADRIEREGETFLRRVREGYLELAEREANVRVVSGEGAPEEVHARLRALLMAEWPGTFEGSLE